MMTATDELARLSPEALHDLARRVLDIDNAYRSVAQKMGQLYICADAHNVASLTVALDEPMRSATESEQTLAAIFEQLRAQVSLREQAARAGGVPPSPTRPRR